LIRDSLGILADLMEQNRRLRKRGIDAERALEVIGGDTWYWHR
jgi:hypothetical protein